MADTNELKPCPFCGGEAYARERTCDKDTPYNPNDRAYPVVRCSKCFTTVCGKDWTGVSTAIEAWNTRADATPTADAALADCLHNIDEVLQYIRPQGEVRSVLEQAAAALRARVVPANRNELECALMRYADHNRISACADNEEQHNSHMNAAHGEYLTILHMFDAMANPQPAPEGMALAFGFLWHIAIDFGCPVPQGFSRNIDAGYAVRKATQAMKPNLTQADITDGITRAANIIDSESSNGT